MSVDANQDAKSIPIDLEKKYIERATFLIEKGYVDETDVYKLALQIYNKEKSDIL